MTRKHDVDVAAGEAGWKPLYRLITWFVLPFLLLALVAALPAEWIKTGTAEVTGPLVARAESDDGDKSVSVLASVPRDLVDSGAPVPFTLTLSNQSAAKIMAPAVLAFDVGEGFEPVAVAELNRQLGTEIPAFGVSRIAARLKPREVLGRYRMTAIVRWTGADQSGHVATVQLGPIRVHRGWKSQLLGFGAPILSLYKDLALPVVVLLAGFLVQQWLARLEEKRRRTEQERSHVQTTWTQMLPTSHRNTSEYYLPALRASGRMKGAYDAWTAAVPRGAAAADRAAAECLYYTMLFAREMKEIREKIGGAFLKSHLVEQVLAILWRFAGRELERVLDLEDMTMVLMRMKRHEAYPSFAQRLRSAQPASPIRRVADRFYAWLGNGYDEILVPLALFNAIFEYELNWPYLHWYEGEGIVYPEKRINDLCADLSRLKAKKIAAYDAATQIPNGEALAGRLNAQVQELSAIEDLLREYVRLAKTKATVHQIAP